MSRSVILIVDDDLGNLSVAGRMLDNTTCAYFTRTNGIEALEVLKRSEEKVDLLMTDVIRPELLNGIALAGIVLQLRPELPIIFMTGGTPEVDIHEIAADLGVAAVIERPVDVDVFRSTVRTVLSGWTKN